MYQITQRTLKHFEELTRFVNFNINHTDDIHTTSILNRNLTDLKAS